MIYPFKGENAVPSVMDALLGYFNNEILGRMLTKEEREQYEKQLAEDAKKAAENGNAAAEQKEDETQANLQVSSFIPEKDRIEFEWELKKADRYGNLTPLEFIEYVEVPKPAGGNAAEGEKKTEKVVKVLTPEEIKAKREEAVRSGELLYFTCAKKKNGVVVSSMELPLAAMDGAVYYGRTEIEGGIKKRRQSLEKEYYDALERLNNGKNPLPEPVRPKAPVEPEVPAEPEAPVEPEGYPTRPEPVARPGRFVRWIIHGIFRIKTESYVRYEKYKNTIRQFDEYEARKEQYEHDRAEYDKQRELDRAEYLKNMALYESDMASYEKQKAEYDAVQKEFEKDSGQKTRELQSEYSQKKDEENKALDKLFFDINSTHKGKERLCEMIIGSSDELKDLMERHYSLPEGYEKDDLYYQITKYLNDHSRELEKGLGEDNYRFGTEDLDDELEDDDDEIYFHDRYNVDDLIAVYSEQKLTERLRNGGKKKEDEAEASNDSFVKNAQDEYHAIKNDLTTISYTEYMSLPKEERAFWTYSGGIIRMSFRQAWINSELIITMTTSTTSTISGHRTTVRA